MASIKQINGDTYINGEKIEIDPGTTMTRTENGTTYTISKDRYGGISCNSIHSGKTAYSRCSLGSSGSVKSKNVTGNNQTYDDTHMKGVGNNNTFRGAYCSISGNNNTFYGAHCKCIGDNNIFHGAHSKCTGNNNTFYGAHCKATGNNNDMRGPHSKAFGMNNTIAYLDPAFDQVSQQLIERKRKYDDEFDDENSEPEKKKTMIVDNEIPEVLLTQFLNDKDEQLHDSLAEEGDKACDICMERKVKLMFQECGHASVCFQCAKQIIDKGGEIRCPMCRTVIHKKLLRIVV
jgi:hypothetical protein